MADAWLTKDLIGIEYNTTWLYWLPTELRCTYRPRAERNIIVQKSISGITKSQEIDGNVREMYELRINRMLYDRNETLDSKTVVGYSSLETLFKTSIPFSGDTITFKPPGITQASGFTARFVGNSWPQVPVVLKRGHWGSGAGEPDFLLMGDGTQRFMIEKEIT